MFPEINIPESQKDSNWAKSFIDAAISFHKTNEGIRKDTLDSLYNAYNGIVKETTKKDAEKKYGSSISTKYTDFKLGRAKLNLLKGEYLDIEITPMVMSVNPDITDKRIKYANTLRGAISQKDFLTLIKKTYGIEFMNGVDIPEPNDPELLEKLYPKTENESIMQIIIEDKIDRLKFKLKGQQSFTDIMVVSECHGVVEKDEYGEDIIRMINPKDAVFQESNDDSFCMKSPFKGERKLMYIKDILSTYDLKETDKKKLRDLAENGNTDEKGFKSLNGISAAEVYTIQWKCTRPEYTKVIPNGKKEPYRRSIEPELFEKDFKKYRKEVKKGKYEIEVDFHDDLWTATRIMQDVYVNVGRIENQIQRLTPSGKYKAEYDYVNFLFGTTDGVRISLQALINSLSEVNNVIMHMIVRELKKLKGKVFVYDEAVKPRLKSMKNIFFEIVEHGMIRVNSSPEGNFSGEDVRNATDIIKELDLGLSQSFNILLELKSNIEYTTDRITGINESREGNNAPSQTATGTMQNIEASRSITKDLFYGHQMFLNELLSLLTEKTKLNKDYLNSTRAKLLLGKDRIAFLKGTEDLLFDDFDTILTDGKKERELRDRIRPMFAGEINAGSLRSKDVLRFEMTKNINEAISMLDDAWDEINKIKQQEMQQQEKLNTQNIEAQKQLAIEDREDRQAHEKELKQMDLSSKERQKGTELNQKYESDQIKEKNKS